MDEDDVNRSYIDILSHNVSYLSDKEKNVRFLLANNGTPIMAFIGILGNLLNTVIFTFVYIRQSTKLMEKSSNMSLLALSASNCAFCLFVFLISVIYVKPDAVTMYFFKLTPSVITYFISTSTWLTVVMSGERYMVVIHPLRAKHLITLKRTRMAILSVFLVCLFAIIPLTFEQRVITETVNGVIEYQLEENVTEGYVIIRRIIWAVCFDFLPLCGLVFFNLFIITHIIKARRKRSEMTCSKLLKRTNKNGRFCFYNRKEEAIELENSALGTRKRSNPYIAGHCLLEPDALLRNEQTDNYKTDNGMAKRSNSFTFGKRRNSLLGILQQEKARVPSSLTKINKSHHITATLLAIVLLFLLLVAPSEILKFCFSLRADNTEEGRILLKIIKVVTNFMQTTNFSLSFVIYYMFHKSFRVKCKKRVKDEVFNSIADSFKI